MPVINKSGKKITYGHSLMMEYIYGVSLGHELKKAFEKMMAERIPALRGQSSLLFFNDNGNDDSIPYEDKNASNKYY